MNAAIYVRKSNKQRGVAEDYKSVTRQIEKAHAFAVERKWTVSAAHIFTDDGISGTEIERRPGFQKMLAEAGRGDRAPFSVLIVTDDTRFGRGMADAPHYIKRLYQAGVKVWSYADQKCLMPETLDEQLHGAIKFYAGQSHVKASSQKSKEALERKFERGCVVGGRVFGYRNIHVYSGEDQHGNPRKSHTERKIDEKEAATVLEIFTLYAEGHGYKAIAKQLNAKRAPSPKPFVRTDPNGVPPVKAWSTSTIRTVIMRELYRGVSVWNRSRKRDPVHNYLDQQPRPNDEWMTFTNEKWRIVPDDLWFRANERRKKRETLALRQSNGTLMGRPPRHETKNLLVGIARCGVCGGGLVVETSQRKIGRKSSYVCHRRRDNGSCDNALRVPVQHMNEAIQSAIEEHALTPEAIEQVLLCSELTIAQSDADRLQAERAEALRRKSKYVEAIATVDGSVTDFAVKVKELDARVRQVDAELAGLRPVPRLPEHVISDRLAEWRRLLRQNTTTARSVLERIIKGTITFTPTGDGFLYDFHAETRFDRLFTGLLWSHVPSASDDDTDAEYWRNLDLDYARLLEQAQARIERSGHVKVVASPTGFEPVFQP